VSTSAAARYVASDWLGRTAQRRVHVSPELVEAFITVSGDSSPIHVIDAAAVARGFEGRVVHGMLLGALVSAVVGTELPGPPGVLQEIKLSFRRPCYVNDDIAIMLAVVDFVESVQVVQLRVSIANRDGIILASGSVQCGVKADHD
jgi:acyl dehydratase